MVLKIAVSGKGGVGKTTVAGVLARLFAKAGARVVAVDADPDSNLASILGIPLRKRETIVPLSKMYDLIEERTGTRPGTSFGGVFKLNPKVDDLLDKYGVEGEDNVKLLVLGSIKSASSGCFCPENALLKNLMRHLLFREDEILVLDMEAGIEHLGRGTTKRVDVLLVVVEPGQRSIETAGRIKELAMQLGIKKVAAVLNKVRTEEEAALVAEGLKKIDLPLITSLPYDEGIAQADLKGTAISIEASPFMNALEGLKQSLHPES